MLTTGKSRASSALSLWITSASAAPLAHPPVYLLLPFSCLAAAHWSSLESLFLLLAGACSRGREHTWGSHRLWPPLPVPACPCAVTRALWPRSKATGGVHTVASAANVQHYPGKEQPSWELLLPHKSFDKPGWRDRCRACSTAPFGSGTHTDRAGGTEASGASHRLTGVSSCLTAFLLSPASTWNQHCQGGCLQLSPLWSFRVSSAIKHHTRVSS